MTVSSTAQAGSTISEIAKLLVAALEKLKAAGAAAESHFADIPSPFTLTSLLEVEGMSAK